MSKNELNDPTPPERLPEHLTHKPEADGNVAPARALTDPVCGMTVTDQSQHKLALKGRTYFFCSAKCQGKFATDPAKFVAPAATAESLRPKQVVAAPGTIYTCPMHPEIRQDHPGNCPKCGMTLEPLLPDLDDDDNPELRDFQRRFWWTLPLTVIVFVLAMLGHRLPWMDMAI